MKAVMSFWTKPSVKNGYKYKSSAGFPSQYYFAVSFWLSFMLAKNWFKRVEVVTDKAGADFIKQIGIPFDKTIVELDKINHIRPELWAFGKIKTYAMQDEPFIHLDYDAYMLKRPDVIMNSDVFVQSPECIHEWYYADNIDFFDKNFEHLPKEWHSYRENYKRMAYNVGIIGGKNYKALQEYAVKGMKIITDNYSVISKMQDADKVNDFNIIYEQYYFTAYMCHRGIKIDTLLPNFESGHRLGYEHFIGGAKNNQNNANKIDMFLRKHFPAIIPKLNNLKIELS